MAEQDIGAAEDAMFHADLLLAQMKGSIFSYTAQFANEWDSYSE